MNRIMILAAGVGLALSSCSTIQHTSQTAGVDTNVYNLTVADMNVAKQKQTMTTEWKWNPLSTVSLKAQKETATAELLREANADVLVEPQYIVKRRGLFRGGSLTVTGYPATYSNFRNMTPEDAEKIAKINGYCDSATVAFAYPVINTSVERPARKPRKAVVKPRLRRNVQVNHMFVSAFGGPLFDADDDFDSSYNVGLMFGRHGHSWGWYGKVAVSHAEGYGDYHDFLSKTTALVTVGAIKPVVTNWNCFFGLGLGGRIRDRYDAKLALPVEIGFQWHVRHINLIAGGTYAFPLTGDGAYGNIAPFVGVGYSF